jgi:hypothetical protein
MFDNLQIYAFFHSVDINDLIIYINDTSGNMNSSSVNFYIDTIKPTVDIYNPASNNSWFSENINVQYAADDENFLYSI